MTDDLGLTRVSTTEIAEEDYFTNNPPPKDLAEITRAAKEFVQLHSKEGRRVALVTSGGTTVPLENQTVRFIDNFSAGTRGATSAEYFIQNGYAVIFLHRRFSLLPYSRHYSHSTNPFLDHMSLDSLGKVIVKDDYQSKMQSVLKKYQRAKAQQTLLLLPFTTITEYLWSLREIAFTLQPLGSNAVFYLAAAVSDFFIPKDRMAEHKIQSGDPYRSGGQSASKKLMIDLDPIPKFLKRLVDGWAPHAMIVSFKLETDPSLLILKANQALQRYSHHLVIGNLLTTRAWEVVLVSPGKEEWIRLPGYDSSGKMSQENDHISVEIESLIVPAVVKLHGTVIERARS